MPKPWAEGGDLDVSELIYTLVFARAAIIDLTAGYSVDGLAVSQDVTLRRIDETLKHLGVDTADWGK